jgi:hypothetical protein
MAPHRSRSLEVIPPERSQNLAAAGRQGAKSLISIAATEVADRIRKSTAVRRCGFIGWISILIGAGHALIARIRTSSLRMTWTLMTVPPDHLQEPPGSHSRKPCHEAPRA